MEGLTLSSHGDIWWSTDIKAPIQERLKQRMSHITQSVKEQLCDMKLTVKVRQQLDLHVDSICNWNQIKLEP